MEDQGSSTTGAPLSDDGGRRMRPSVVATLVMVAVFVFGVLAGAAVDRHLVHSGWMEGRPRRDGRLFVPGLSMPAGPRTPSAGADSMRRRASDEFTRALGLTAEQASAVDSVMARDFQAVNALREQMRPRIDSIIGGTRQRIDSLITPAQREKYHALLAQQQQRLERREGGGPGERRGPRF
jgi:hypothetical protein